MKFAVITFIFGKDYEKLREIDVKDKNAEYLCITDNKKLKSKTWKVIYDEKLAQTNWDSRQRYYYAKYHFFDYTKCDVVVRIDGSIKINGSLQTGVDDFLNSGGEMGFGLHPYNQIPLREYDDWINNRQLNPIFRDNFVTFAQKNNFDLGTKGLVETCFMVCKRTINVINALDCTWATMLMQTELKDQVEQIWFSYVIEEHFMDKLALVFYYPRQPYCGSDKMQWYEHNLDSIVEKIEVDTSATYFGMFNNQKVQLSYFV